MKTQALVALVSAAVYVASASFAQELSKDLVKPTGPLLNMRALAFSADGRLLAACSGEPTDKGKVAVWDIETRTVRWSHQIERGMPSVAFSPDGKTVAVGSFTENCYLFDAGTGKLQSKLAGHGEAARSVAFAPDGQTLAVGSYDKTIRLWDWRAAQIKATLTGQEDRVYSLAYTPNGKTLASGGGAQSACLWDVANGKLLHRWQVRASPMAFEPKGQWLATAGNDSSVRSWQPAAAMASFTFGTWRATK